MTVDDIRFGEFYRVNHNLLYGEGGFRSEGSTRFGALKRQWEKMSIVLGMDPWAIQPRERARYRQQFESLMPINGVVTGEQAKQFLLQSQLPPVVLGQIW